MMPWDMLTTVVDYWNYKLRDQGGDNEAKSSNDEEDLNK